MQINLQISELIDEISRTIKDKYQDKILRNVGINKKLEVSKSVFYPSHYEGVQKVGNRTLIISISISTDVVRRFKGTCVPQESGNYDITIKEAAISDKGVLTVIASDIFEVGTGEKQIFVIPLEKHCKENGFYDSDKRKLPNIIKSVLAITTMSDVAGVDALSDLGLKEEFVRIRHCQSGEEIASVIGEFGGLFDVIVLFRDGVEDEDMKLFSEIPVLDAINATNKPVVVALGRAEDVPFVYKVADYSYSTPASFVKNMKLKNKEEREYLLYSNDKIRENMVRFCKAEEQYLSEAQEKIKNFKMHKKGSVITKKIKTWRDKWL